MQFELNGNTFVKSSFSMRDDRCVAVSIQDSTVLVTNSKERTTIVTFTHDEWSAFIDGVKSGEFDLSGV